MTPVMDSHANEPESRMMEFSVQLATLSERVPAGPGWLYEYKYDGYRLVTVSDRKGVRLLTRSGQDWTGKFKGIAGATVAAMGGRSFAVDGELVAVNAHGKISFQALQQALRHGLSSKLRYFLFDILKYEGKDLRELPLTKRREVLERALKAQGSIATSPVLAGNGERLLKRACRQGFEGIIAKRADGIYRGGRGRAWLKCKCSSHEELLVAGFTPHSKFSSQIGALLTALRVEKDIYLFCGKVGTGFTDADRSELFGRLHKAETRDVEFLNRSQVPRAARLVVPTLVCEVRFGEWTNDGLLRHPSFLGLRSDKPASEVLLGHSSHPARTLSGSV